MRVQEIMTPHPACCTPQTSLQEVARMMVINHCGAIPVVDSLETLFPLGIVTDRDITCRTVAEGQNPLALRAADCMSAPLVTIPSDASLDQCCALLQDNQIRRVPVVDMKGRCVGIVAQADVVRNAPTFEASELLRVVSQPTKSPSQVIAA